MRRRMIDGTAIAIMVAGYAIVFGILSAQTTIFDVQALNPSGSQDGVCEADSNGDGSIDLIGVPVEGGGGGAWVYDVTDWSTVRVTSATHLYEGCAWGFYDDDPYIDLALASPEQFVTVSWGPDYLAAGDIASSSGKVWIECDAGDLNGDGRYDLACSAQGFVGAFLMDGTRNLDMPRIKVSKSLTFRNSIHVLDFDGDGDMDIAGNQESLGGAFGWHENLGNGTAWVAHNVASIDGAYKQRIGEFCDLDRNGQADYLMGVLHSSGGAWPEIAVVWNSTSTTSTLAYMDDPSWPSGDKGAKAPGCGDFDNDGDMDILISTGDDLQGLYLMRGPLWDAVEIVRETGDPEKFDNFAVFDHGLDCDLDAVTTNESGPNVGLVFLENTVGGCGGVEQTPTPTPEPTATPTPTPTPHPWIGQSICDDAGIAVVDGVHGPCPGSGVLVGVVQ